MTMWDLRSTTWVRMGWTEWRRAFCRDAGGGTGSRDFLWLTLLLALTFFLTIFLWSTREGLLDQFVNVSLGYVEDHGIPIWVVAEINPAVQNGLDRELLDRLRGLDIERVEVFPYREVEPREIALPGMIATEEVEVWSGIDFLGRAVSDDDPLWPGAAAPPDDSETGPPFPRTVALNRGLFEEHFRCGAYEDALSLGGQTLSGFTAPAPAEDTEDPLDCLRQGHIWLDVQVGQRRELVKFRIRWKNWIPGMEKVAFLVPMDTFHALKLAYFAPEIRYYPEGEGRITHRVRSLMVWPRQGERSAFYTDALRNCFGRGTKVRGNTVTLRTPTTLDRVRPCLESADLTLKEDEDLPRPYAKIGESVEGSRLAADERGFLRAPCDLVPSIWLRGSSCGDDGLVVLDPVLAISGFQKAIVYVPSRRELFPALEAMRGMRGTNPHVAEGDGASLPVLYIHPVYEDALTRFDFISKVMDKLRTHYSVLLVLFLAVLMLVQLVFVIHHRRRSYGVLLSKGFTWNELRNMLTLQIAISALLAWIAAAILVQIPSVILTRSLAALIASDFQNRLTRLDMLPVGWTMLAAVGLVGSAIACGMAVLIFGRLRSRNKEPSRLLHE